MIYREALSAAFAFGGLGGPGCDRTVPNIDIHDSIGRLDTTRDASCGTKPANKADRNIQRHGRLHTSAAPIPAAPSTSTNGLRLASGLMSALDASLATWATGLRGWFDHQDCTDSMTAFITGKTRILLVHDSFRSSGDCSRSPTIVRKRRTC